MLTRRTAYAGTQVLENFRLKVFRAVAEHLSFRKAGYALYLTQPAVTLQIKTLEGELGTKLFERKPSGVFLTDAGKLLLQFAGELHRISVEAENQMIGVDVISDRNGYSAFKQRGRLADAS